MSSQWQSPWNAAERKATRKMLMSMLRTASISRVATALAIPVSCLVYMLSSSWVILANQRLITEAGFPFPILLSAFGTFASAATAHLSVLAGLTTVRKEASALMTGKSWFYSVVPVALCQASTLAFGNATYLFLGIGSTQMLKAGTPICILLVLVALRLESPSLGSCCCVCLITVGTFITAAISPEWNVGGLSCSVAAMITEALRIGLTQFLLRTCKFSVTEGQYVLAPTVSAALLSASLAMESQKLLEVDVLDKLFKYPHLFLFAAGLGTVVNYSSYMVIKSCGALSLKIVTTFRNVSLVAYGAMMLGEPIKPKHVTGYALALVGFLGYTYFGNAREQPKSVAASENGAGCSPHEK
ncbi:unnamed protein product [Symbiodinium sp. CCMP2456]|nr:unnamed protein product [Symbiodinium sp. CCMP2456]